MTFDGNQEVPPKIFRPQFPPLKIISRRWNRSLSLITLIFKYLSSVEARCNSLDYCSANIHFTVSRIYFPIPLSLALWLALASEMLADMMWAKVRNVLVWWGLLSCFCQTALLQTTLFYRNNTPWLACWSKGYQRYDFHCLGSLKRELGNSRSFPWYLAAVVIGGNFVLLKMLHGEEMLRGGYSGEWKRLGSALAGAWISEGRFYVSRESNVGKKIRSPFWEMELFF